MNQNRSWKTPLYFACGLVLLAVPGLAVDSARGGGSPALTPIASPLAAGGNWMDHFDSYVTGSQMHGQGGWKGWGNVPAAGALTSSSQARSPLNSVDALGATDLVQEFSLYTTGTWTFTAWQLIPTGLSANTYFILLNSYDDAGNNLNWSTQICFQSATGSVIDDVPGNCSGTSTVAIVYDQWVEIRVVIDLDTNTQTFFYNGQQLYQDSWTEHVSGAGAVNIGAVDLFANGASSVFYDDISLSNLPFLDGFETQDTSPWHLTVP